MLGADSGASFQVSTSNRKLDNIDSDISNYTKPSYGESFVALSSKFAGC